MSTTIINYSEEILMTMVEKEKCFEPTLQTHYNDYQSILHHILANFHHKQVTESSTN